MHDSAYEPGIMGRRIGVHLTPKSLAPRVLEALRALGYVMIDLDSDRIDDEIRDACRLVLVDQLRLAELAGPDRDADRRILLIASASGRSCEDPRIFATTRRPARLGAVYEMIQSALESTPRSTPRIRTRLSARCIQGDQRSIGAVLSLSEGGCLLRSGDPVAPGAAVQLQFALPSHGLVSTHAECRYARSGDAGLAFAGGSSELRHAISHFVTLQLASGEGASGEGRSSDGALSA